MKNKICIFILMFLLVGSMITIGARETLSSCPSNSMYPTIRCDDTVYIKTSLKKGDVRINDIVMFPNPFVPKLIQGSHTTLFYVLHRIVGVTKYGYITKGDNNNFKDQWLLNKSSVEGKFIRVIN